MADHVQPGWLCKLPYDVLNLIAERTRDAVTGLTTFRAVCRTWRAAVGPAPRLLLPSPQNAAALHDSSDHALVFPLSCGWSIVVDPRDLSCHLSHLATGTTAALPKLNALCDGGDTSKITLLRYEDDSDLELPFMGKNNSHEDLVENSDQEAAPLDANSVGDPEDLSTEQEAYSFDEGSAPEDQSEYSFDEDSVCEDVDDNAPSSDEGSTREDLNEYFAYVESLFLGRLCEYQDEHFTDKKDRRDRQHKIKIYSHDGDELDATYNEFSNYLRFAIHVPPSTMAGSTEGIVIMMYHSWLHARTNGMVFCRPGDVTWTKISNPNSKGRNFADFAYFDGKMFALNNECVTLVFDATTHNLLYQVNVPPETANCFTKLCCGNDSDEHQSLHLLALPHKLLLVKVFMSDSDSCKPDGFHVFELRHQDANGLAWCKVTGEDVGCNYELFLDSYHATFSNSGDGSGTRIYHADNELFGSASCVWGYCYNMQDNKLECIHEPPEDANSEYSTKPSWFVP